MNLNPFKFIIDSTLELTRGVANHNLKLHHSIYFLNIIFKHLTIAFINLIKKKNNNNNAHEVANFNYFPFSLNF